jgi:hypothetical protein
LMWIWLLLHCNLYLLASRSVITSSLGGYSTSSSPKIHIQRALEPQHNLH